MRKVYELLPDARAGKEGYARVIDESGEDYLYPAAYFVPVKLPRQAEARRLAGSVVAVEIFEIMREGRPFNRERFIVALKNLPGLPFDSDR